MVLQHRLIRIVELSSCLLFCLRITIMLLSYNINRPVVAMHSIVHVRRPNHLSSHTKYLKYNQASCKSES
uniref:Secreted protein n=1 Tax=Ascaris lumbricoides TaxID=6252 RepID=A0A0M3ICP5_ASCLU